MKQLLTTFMLCAAASMMAQTSPTAVYKAELLGYKQTDNYYEAYEYDSQNRTVAIYESEPEMDKIRFLYEYDQEGRVIKETVEERIQNYWYAIGHSDIVWDNNGRISSTLNYNHNVHGEEYLSNQREYAYDENGRLTDMVAWHGKDLTLEYSVSNYEYNEEGLVSKMSLSMRDFPNADDPLLPYQEIYYEYDSEGRLIKYEIHTSNINDGEMELTMYLVNNYTATGEIDDTEIVRPGGSKTAYIYEYATEIERAEIRYPYVALMDVNYDNYRVNDYAAHNIGKYPVIRRTEMRLDLQTNDMYVYGSRFYNYEPNVGKYDSVEDLQEEVKAQLEVSIHGGLLVLRGVEAGAKVAIYTVDGKLVEEFNYDGPKSLSMAPGIYVVNAGTDSALLAY